MREKIVLMSISSTEIVSPEYKILEHDVSNYSEYHTIHYSEYGDWSNNLKGKQAGSYTDTGNEIRIEIGSKKIKLNYSEAAMLFALMLNSTNIKTVIKEEIVTKQVV
jgi:hypothetical protein